MSSYFDYALATASFEGVEFPCALAPVEEGHDFAEHVAKGRRGADLEHNQQRPASGTLEIPLSNDARMVRRWGTMLPDKLVALRAKFVETPIGNLFHPLYGSFTAGMKRWRIAPDPQRRNDLVLSVDWIEHNGEAALFLEDARTPDSHSALARVAAILADALALATGVAGYRALAAPVTDAIELVSEATATPARIAAQIETVLTSVACNLALFGEADHAAVVAELERTQAGLYAMRRALLDDIAATYIVPATMPVYEIAARVYGDARMGPQLAAANALPDPLAVPAGTVLVLPPV